MIDMSFTEFLALLVVSLIASLAVHYGIRYRHFQSVEGFFWKWIISWFFAWLGSPVFGHWFVQLRVQNVFLVPALLGGFVGAFCAAAVWRGGVAPQKTTT